MLDGNVFAYFCFVSTGKEKGFFAMHVLQIWVNEKNSFSEYLCVRNHPDQRIILNISS